MPEEIIDNEKTLTDFEKEQRIVELRRTIEGKSYV